MLDALESSRKINMETRLIWILERGGIVGLDKSGSRGVVWVGTPPRGQSFQESGCRKHMSMMSELY